jgi:hypothetical protein
MRVRKPWTDAEVEKLRSLAGRCPLDQIAQALGHSSHREEGLRSENFPRLSPASTTARQPRSWSGRYGPHRLMWQGQSGIRCSRAIRL